MRVERNTSDDMSEQAFEIESRFYKLFRDELTYQEGNLFGRSEIIANPPKRSKTRSLSKNKKKKARQDEEEPAEGDFQKGTSATPEEDEKLGEAEADAALADPEAQAADGEDQANAAGEADLQ